METILTYIKTNLLGIISLIIACISVVFAFTSNLTSRKAYRLSKQEFDNKSSRFELYLIDSFKYKSIEKSKILLFFNITIINKSTFNNSFKAALEVEYIRSDDSVARAIFKHNPDLNNYLPAKSLSIFSTDIEINSKTLKTSWLIFDLPIDLIKDNRIEKYSIKVIDVDNNEVFVDAILIKDLDEESN